MTNAPAPGWYEDPHDATRVRWWDGSSWSEETHANPNDTDSLNPEPENAIEPEPTAPTEFVHSPDEFVLPSTYTSGVETYEEIKAAGASPQSIEVMEEDSPPVPVAPLRTFGSMEEEVVLVSTDPSEFRSDSVGVKLATNRWKKRALKTIGIVSVLALVGIAASWVLYFRLDIN